jgi:hypothetical protein
VGIRHSFQRRECFGGDDEKRFRRIEIADSFRKVRAIDIGNKPERQFRIAVML